MCILKSKSTDSHILKFLKVQLILYFIQMAIYPIFNGQFWLLNISQMLITMINLVYILYCALSLNEIGVLLRIFGAMSKVVVVFGCCSVIIIVLIAYPIHATFINFSQPIEGQISPTSNWS